MTRSIWRVAALIAAPVRGDLLDSDRYAPLTEDVVEGRSIALAPLDGVECDHRAFRDARPAFDGGTVVDVH